MKARIIVRYSHLNRPSAPKGSQSRSYSIQGLIAKNDPACVEIEKEVENAKLNGFPSGFPAKAEVVCWKDMAKEAPDVPELHGYMMLAASTKEEHGAPMFVDSSLQPITDPSVEGNLTGQYVWVDFKVASYDQVSKGVKAYLNGTMHTGEPGPIPSEKLSSKPTATSMFGDVTGSAEPTPTPDKVMAPGCKYTYEQLKAANWTDEQMIRAGYLLPGGAPLSFK